ncbi:MAG: response regulator [Candidatus Omnitrophica bacterium]|nr:response regulator [Candidatus Omnitrophota bacterium]
MPEKRILVIEDSSFICTMLETGFRANGFQVSIAHGGKEGLLLARSEKPDLIVLDLVLPEMPGEEVCRRLKRDAETDSIPVVMLTAKDSDADRVRGRVIGADAYIPKPFTMEKLMETIGKFLTACIVCFVFCLPMSAGAQEQEDAGAVPPGMELIKVGGTDILIPRGTKVTKKDALLILEPPEQFMARRILAMEEEIERLAQASRQLQQEIADLKKALQAQTSKPVPGPE